MREGEFSVQAILGAMLDGLIVVDEERRIQMMNPAFPRLLDREQIEPARRYSKPCAMRQLSMR